MFYLLNFLRKENTIYLFFLLGWLVLNLLQSYFTQLHYDEAYYWGYSRRLAWGYFDHPPFIALIIKAGYFIFNNELGVRLLPVFLSTLTLFMIWKLTDDKSNPLFFIIFLLSFITIQTHVGGFLAIPDTPLLFFTGLFFIIYQKFVENNTLKQAIILAIIIAAMLYSKYHGILIIVFTLLSNLKLVKNKYFWVIIILVLILMLPHIYWQYQNNYPSIKYHMSDRSDPLKIKSIIHYLYSQVLMAGLFTGIISFYLAFSYKTKNVFEKALKFNVIGFYAFFFLASFKGWVEAHWTAAVYIPMVLISFKEIQTKPVLKKWFVRLAIPSILLIFCARFVLVNEEWGSKLNYFTTFHKWDEAVSEINNVKGKKEVAFIGSYKVASLYSFYSGEKKIAPMLPTGNYRYSQFDLWHADSILNKKNILLVGRYLPTEKHFNHENIYQLKYMVVDSFVTYRGLSIEAKNKTIDALPGDSVIVKFKIQNTTNQDIIFNPNSDILLFIQFRIIEGNKVTDQIFKISNMVNQPSILISQLVDININIKVPEKKGKYKSFATIYFGNEKFRGQRTNNIEIIVKN